MKPIYLYLALLITACQPKTTVTLVTLDPGHFHAALVQKTHYAQVDHDVYVYAPDGNDVKAHLQRIHAYNTRSDNPTHWNEIVYTGADFVDQMVAAQKNKQLVVVVTAGNNQRKTEYIGLAVDAGFHVLSDKPMAIDTDDFGKLLACFETAKQHNVTLYDIMTERFEITSILQKEFSLIPSLYGEQLPGTPDDPAVVKESVHHFAKTVSGTTLQRPPWYFDVKQQGEGITDVATHLVDLVQWTLFPNQIIDYQQDIALINAKHWTTTLSKDQFKEVTGYSDFPDYLADHISNDSLYVYSNGEIFYRIKGIHAKVSVIWNYAYPEGGGDTHFSSMKGSRATLSIRQGAAQNYIPALFVALNGATENDLYDAVQLVAQKYPGIELKQSDHTEWEITIPDTYRNGHEAHFAQVTENFLTYIQTGLPQWEVPNMIAKYYVTTRALEIAQQSE